MTDLLYTSKSQYSIFKKSKTIFVENQSCQLVFRVHHYCVVCRKVVLSEKLGVLNLPTISRLNGALKKKKLPPQKKRKGLKYNLPVLASK